MIKYESKIDKSSLKIIVDNNNIDLKSLDSNGNTIIHRMIFDKRPMSIIKSILRNYPDINKRNNNGLTPLFCAVVRNDYSICKLLLENGADPNVENNNDIHPLIYLTRNIRQRDINILLINSKEINTNVINEYYIEMVKSVHNTSKYYNEKINDILNVLSTGKVDINTKCSNGHISLYYTIGYKNNRVTKKLLSFKNIVISDELFNKVVEMKKPKLLKKLYDIKKIQSENIEKPPRTSLMNGILMNGILMKITRRKPAVPSAPESLDNSLNEDPPNYKSLSKT